MIMSLKPCKEKLDEKKKLIKKNILMWFLNTLEFNKGFYIDTSRFIFEYFKIKNKMLNHLIKTMQSKIQ
jgi:hypothetical protein